MFFGSLVRDFLYALYDYDATSCILYCLRSFAGNSERGRECLCFCVILQLCCQGGTVRQWL